MNLNSKYSLAQVTDLFMNERGITKKKYFSQFIIIARFVWKDLFQNTLWTTKSEWLTVQVGDPFNYIIIPKDAQRIFSVAVEDDCHKIVPLFYNNRLNVVKKPKVKKCGCTTCNCAGLCAEVSSLTYTTKLWFTVNGVNYYQKEWLQVCPNGDVLKWTETPTKKYNTLVGDSGDFNDDFNNDYSIAAAPFSAYTIVTVTSQEKICNIEVAPCGCPVESEENIECFNNYCGFFLDCCSPRKKKCCDDFLNNPNNNERGECKISECGNYMYYKPGKRWKSVTNRKIPEFLLLNYQTSGENCTNDVMVPEYALDAMFMGMQYRSKRLKDSFSASDKLASKWDYEDAKSKLILYLSPFSLEELAHIQDAPIKW